MSKEVTWDVFKDIKNFSGTMVIRIEYREDPKKPLNKWVVVSSILLSGSIIAISMVGDSQKNTSPELSAIEYGTIVINVTFPE